MQVFYKVKGSADNDYSAGVIEAKNKPEATEMLDKRYGIIRDESGKQTNSNMITLVLIQQNEFKAIEKNRGKELTHRIDGYPQFC